MQEGERNCQWHVGLTHYKITASLAWPVDVKKVPQYPSEFYISFHEGVKDVTVLVLEDWSKIKGFIYAWHSWSWQCQNFPRARAKWAPGIRPFTTTRELHLKCLAALLCFWMFTIPDLKTIAGPFEDRFGRRRLDIRHSIHYGTSVLARTHR